MSKGPRLSRLGVLAPAALSVCVDASVLAAPAAGAILSTVLKELSKAFMLKKWFHGVMTASEAENLLMQQGKNGSYLVRESQTHPGEYVLSVRVRGRVSHVMIKREKEQRNSQGIFQGGTCSTYLAQWQRPGTVKGVQMNSGSTTQTHQARVSGSPEQRLQLCEALANARSQNTVYKATMALRNLEETIRDILKQRPGKDPQVATIDLQLTEDIKLENNASIHYCLKRLYLYCAIAYHNKYDVGSGEVFDDLTGLIEHCRAYPLIEASGDVLRLMQPVSGLRVTAQPQDIIQVGAMNGIERHRNLGDDLDDSQESVVSNGSSSDSNRPFDEDKMFEAEFRSLKVVDESTPFTKNEGQRQENRYKNRFRNVLPYDQTRVTLPNHLLLPESDFSDYINASYIKSSRLYEDLIKTKNDKENAELMDVAGASLMETSESEMEDVLFRKVGNLHLGMPAKKEYNYGLVKNKYYIATQGCLWTTMHAFWQMIVHNDVRVIAMLTEGVENGKRKCEKYWPEEGETRRYGDVQVTNSLESEYSYYIIRQFDVMTSDRNHTKIFQYQFKDWPDHDVPLETESILSYVKDINERMYLVSQATRVAPPKENILLVHCSAGIGRTGTFIALDMIIEKLKKEGFDTSVNIHSIVKEHAKLCRYQRAGMVQNTKQYKFLFFAVEDFVEKARNEGGDHSSSHEAELQF